MNYSLIRPLVADLEDKWQAKLRSYDNPDPRIANGEWQFFDIEDVPVDKRTSTEEVFRERGGQRKTTTTGGSAPTMPGRNNQADTDLPDSLEPPVVLAIGANYTQRKGSQRVWGKSPYLGEENGKPRVTPVKSSGNGSIMRRCLDDTFAAYSNNPADWTQRCLASDDAIAVGPQLARSSYILIATNFSPLITYLSWQNYPPQYRAHMLTLFNAGFDYLDNLLAVLNTNGVGIFVHVGHGLHSEVPALFRQWQTKHRIKPWMITANLARPFPKSTAKRKAFYEAKIPEGPTPEQRDTLVNFIE